MAPPRGGPADKIPTLMFLGLPKHKRIDKKRALHFLQSCFYYLLTGSNQKGTRRLPGRAPEATGRAPEGGPEAIIRATLKHKHLSQT